MKIGFVANSSWNLYNFRSALIQALQDEGHEVFVFAPKDVYTQRLVNMGCTFVPVRMEVKGTNPLEDLKLTRRLYKGYAKHKLDYVFHYTIKPNIYGSIASRFVKTKAINNVTGLGTVFIRSSPAARIARLLYRIAFLFPTKVFFQNDDDRKLFTKRFIVKKKITGLVPGSGIDTAYFKSKNPLPTSGTPFTFLMIARMLYDKGIREYIGAIRKLRAKGNTARFILLGKVNEDKGLGVSLKTIEAWQKEGLIEYWGTRDDVREVIEQAHCVVLPSYREGTPRTLLEAASMSRPIITTDVPGCRETIDRVHPNGFLCKVRDEDSLAEAMQKMYETSEEDRLHMGRNSRKFAKNRFSVRLVIEKYLEAISEGASKKQASKEEVLTPFAVHEVSRSFR